MNTKHVILTQHYPSPCGDLILGSYEDRLRLLQLGDRKTSGQSGQKITKPVRQCADYKEGKSDIIQEAARQIQTSISKERADNVRYSHTIHWYGFPDNSVAHFFLEIRTSE